MKSTETEDKWLLGAGEFEGKQKTMTANGNKISFGSDEKVVRLNVPLVAPNLGYK